MAPDDLRSLLRRQPFTPITLDLSDGRSFEVTHPDYLIVPPERTTVVFVFHKGGSFDIVGLRQITSVSGEGDVPTTRGRRSKPDQE